MDHPSVPKFPKKRYGAKRKTYGAQRKRYRAPRKYRQKRQAADEPKHSAVKVDDIELENSNKDNLKLSFKTALNLTGLTNSERKKREVGNKRGFRTLSYDDYEGKILVICCSSIFSQHYERRSTKLVSWFQLVKTLCLTPLGW